MPKLKDAYRFMEDKLPFRSSNKWYSSLDLPTILMFMLSVVTIIISMIVIRMRQDDSERIPEMYEGGRGLM